MRLLHSFTRLELSSKLIMSQTATTTIQPGHVSDGDGVFELSRFDSSSRNTSGRILSSSDATRDFVALREESAQNSPPIPDDNVPPTNAYTEVERWNYPRGNIAKIVFAFVSAMVAGMNDAAVGVSRRPSALKVFTTF